MAPPMAHSPAYYQNQSIISASLFDDREAKNSSLQPSPALSRYVPPTTPVHAHTRHDRMSDGTWAHVRSPSSQSVNSSNGRRHQFSPTSSSTSSTLPQFEHRSMTRHSHTSHTQVYATDGNHSGQRSPSEGWESQGHNTTVFTYIPEQSYPEEPPNHAVRVLVSLICMHIC